MSDTPSSKPPAEPGKKTLSLPSAGPGPVVLRKHPDREMQRHDEERKERERREQKREELKRKAEQRNEQAEPDARLDFGKPVRICGLPAVQALFDQAPYCVERLFYDPKLKVQAGPFCQVMARKRKPYRMVEGEELARVAGTVLHGGIVAVAHPRLVPEFDPQAAEAWAAAGEPLFLLDGVGNPHNLGAIARTMAFFGLKHLVLSDHPAQAMPSDASFRVAEGGLEYVNLHRAEHFARSLKRLKPHYRVVGTALGQGRPLDELSRSQPVALILGNEETGLDARSLEACDDVVNIPGSGQVQSLNVSATAAILIYELSRRRG